MSPDGRNPLPRARWPDLVARALGAMRRREARSDAADRDWARSILTPAEFDLWSGLSAHDRRHTIQVARRVEQLSEEEFTRKVVAELSALGLVDPKEVLETRPHFIPNAYPVCANGYARDVGVIREALASIGNLETLGRAGRFVYSHLHDQLRFGKDCVRSLVDARRADTA